MRARREWALMQCFDAARFVFAPIGQPGAGDAIDFVWPRADVREAGPWMDSGQSETRLATPIASALKVGCARRLESRDGA